MKKSFISLLRKALFIPPLVITIFSVAGWSVQEYFSWKHEFVEEVSKIVEERKSFIKERTRIAASYIDFQRASSLIRKKTLMESKILDTYDFIDSLHGVYKDSEKQEFEKQILKTLDEMAFYSYGGFILNESGDHLFGNGKLVPSHSLSFERIPSDFLIDNIDKNMDARSLISYVFEKSDEDPGRFKRFFCLKRFHPSGWVIGMSASYDEVEKESMATIKDWFSHLESIGSQGFIFIIGSDGQIISNSGMPQMVGRNIREAVNGSSDILLKDFFGKEGEFKQIDWWANDSQSIRSSQSSGFFVPEWGWTVGVGFFMDDLEKAFEYKKARGKYEILAAVRFLIVTIPIFIIIGVFAYRRIALKLEKNFLNFHSFFKNAQEKRTIIEIAEMDFSEFESMADAANKMLEERQNSEFRLRQSESNFASFFNSIEDSIFVVDEDLKILAMNPSATSSLDLSQTSPGQNYIKDFYDTESVDSICRFVFDSPEQTKEIGTGFLSRVETSKKTVETFIFKGTWNSGKSFFILSRDISDLIASEEKFSNIFSESPVMMSVSTIEEGIFMDINKTATEYLDYPREAFIGKLSMETGIFADPEWRTKMKPKMEKYGHIRNEEVDLVTKSGKILHCIFSMDLISYSGQKYILTVGNNITERKKAEQSLMAAKEEALESKARLEETLRELELFNRFMMDREERIISLKAEVNLILQEAGKEPLYNVEDYIDV